MDNKFQFIFDLIDHGTSDRLIAAECSLRKITKTDLIELIRDVFTMGDQVEEKTGETENDAAIRKFNEFFGENSRVRNYMRDLRQNAKENCFIGMIRALRFMFRENVDDVQLKEARDEITRVYSHETKTFLVEVWVFRGMKFGYKNIDGEWAWTPMPGE